MWTWIKDKWRRFKKWIVVSVLGVGIALAATQIPLPEPIPEHLQLKVSKDQVIAHLIDDEVVKYAYKSRLVQDKPNEIVSKRTSNTRFFIPEKPNQTKMEISVGHPYYKDQDKWYRVEIATTTKDAFNEQMGFNNIFGQSVFAADYSIVAGADDGYVLPGATVFNNSDPDSMFGSYTGWVPGYNIWLRFAAITAGQGDDCTAATIEFITNGVDNGTDIQMAIQGVDEDDHTAPTDYATWATDNGILTSAKVDWDFATLYTAGESIVTDDFADVIDEILARGGWATGQDIGIQINDDGCASYAYRNVIMYEDETYTEPVLSLTIESAEPPAEEPRPRRMEVIIVD